MKTLVLCRHAKSDWPLNVQDIDRPLKARGQKDAGRLAKILKKNAFKPDLIISSPGRRALDTAEIIRDKLGYKGNIKVDRAAYFEGDQSLLNIITNIDDQHDTVMIFGHNPTMENVVQYLTKMGSPYEMPTSGMACFESYATSWSQFVESNTRLRWLLVPRLMRIS
ncbi:MAG: histidine phosphatase family protein [Bacteroidia bacterium]